MSLIRNITNWLIELFSPPRQPRESINDNIQITQLNEAEFQIYLEFLLEVLQTTAESQGNPQVVYPLLAANTDKLNLIFAQILQVWVTKTLAEAEVDTAKFLAAVMVEFGNLIQQFPLGNKANNMEIALAAYQQALEVYTRTDFPLNNAVTLLNLGILYQESEQLKLAYDTFESAIITVEDLRGEIISGEESKRKQAEEWNQLFRRMVEVCLGLGREAEAITYIERSKTRNLVELISAKIDFQPIQYPEIENLLDEKTAIIQFYIFNDCFRVFIITRNHHKPIIWQSTKSDLDKLTDWMFDEYLNSYYSDRSKWSFNLDSQLRQLREILHFNQILEEVPSQIQKIVIIPHRYLHRLPFHAIPLSTNLGNSEYLFDRYPAGVSYAPSCQLLKLTQKAVDNSVRETNRTRLSNLFAIQDPNNNLPFTNIEVETIATNFNPHQILKNQQANKNAFALETAPKFDDFTNSQWLHFSCHGSFDLQSPFQSALLLADAEVNPNFVEKSSSRYVRVDEETTIDLSKCLTLTEILELKLKQCYLVCLSACETGVIYINNKSDEFIGLSSGFIKAGAENIVSSLWKVNDFHTSLLMIRLYENIAKNPDDITLALNQSQEWLRKATRVEIVDWVNKIEMKQQQKQQILDYLSNQYQPEQKPFRKPEYWAGFCAVSPGK